MSDMSYRLEYIQQKKKELLDKKMKRNKKLETDEKDVSLAVFCH